MESQGNYTDMYPKTPVKILKNACRLSPAKTFTLAISKIISKHVCWAFFSIKLLTSTRPSTYNSKSKSVLIHTLQKLIQNSRSRIFLDLKLHTKLFTFTIKLNHALQLFEITKFIFSRISMAGSIDELSGSVIFNDTEPLIEFSHCLEKLRVKSLCRAFFRVLNYRKRPVLMDAKSLTQAFYKKKIEEHLGKMEKKLKTKEEILKSSGYLKIIAYSKALKHQSPFKSKNNTPTKTPIKNSVYTPEAYRPSPRPSLKNNPKYYPIYKMLAFLNQNHFIVTAFFFKSWSVQKYLEMIDNKLVYV